MEDVPKIDDNGDIGFYLTKMYERVENDNSVTGKIGRVRIVMFIEEEVNKPFGGD